MSLLGRLRIFLLSDSAKQGRAAKKDKEPPQWAYFGHNSHGQVPTISIRLNADPEPADFYCSLIVASGSMHQQFTVRKKIKASCDSNDGSQQDI